MISCQKNFIFVHIPKTAGNSIQNIIRNYSEDHITCKASHQDGFERFEIKSKEFGTTKHSTLADYKKVLPSDFYDNAYKFTCVRNPWDRMVSFYFSPHRKVKQWNRNDFIKFIHQVPSAISYLVLPNTSNYKSIFQYFDYIITFDKLDSGFKAVCGQIGIPYEELPVRNKAKKQTYTKYYDAELVDIVAGLFSTEIELFKFSYAE